MAHTERIALNMAVPAGVAHYTCALCGFQFLKPAQACGNCAIVKSVCFGESAIAACPRCGHQFPLESSLVNFVSKLFFLIKGKNAH